MDRQRNLIKNIKKGVVMVVVGIALLCLIYFLSVFTSNGLNLFLIKHFKPLYWARVVSVMLKIFAFLTKVAGMFIASAGFTIVILNLKKLFELR